MGPAGVGAGEPDQLGRQKKHEDDDSQRADARDREPRDQDDRQDHAALHPVRDEQADHLSQRRPERSEEHTSELQSLAYLVCRLLLEKKKKTTHTSHTSYTQTPHHTR